MSVDKISGNDTNRFAQPAADYDKALEDKKVLRDVAILGTAIKAMGYALILICLPVSSVAIVGVTLKALCIVDLTLHFGSMAFVLYQNATLPKINYPETAANQ
ncbi:MAG: hypothetical protein P0S94_04890 [Simkaniaceae bacterium]|nr:hypothetical protein [Simkaniaceae bacterium]